MKLAGFPSCKTQLDFLTRDHFGGHLIARHHLVKRNTVDSDCTRLSLLTVTDACMPELFEPSQ